MYKDTREIIRFSIFEKYTNTHKYYYYYYYYYIHHLIFVTSDVVKIYTTVLRSEEK